LIHKFVLLCPEKLTDERIGQGFFMNHMDSKIFRIHFEKSILAGIKGNSSLSVESLKLPHPALHATFSPTSFQAKDKKILILF